MAKPMTGVELQLAGWSLTLDYEGLVDRLGPSHAIDVWSIVDTRGSHTASSGVTYRRIPSLKD